MQQSSSGLGGAFGEDNNFGTSYHTRRGFEKFLWNGTIIVGILFIVTAFAALKV
jgi:protein translocase SecG subunit